MDTTKFEVRAAKDLAEGTELTFFYPSTEWDMAQPFECWCGAGNCLKLVRGAKYLTADDCSGRHMNHHIMELMKQRAAEE